MIEGAPPMPTGHVTRHPANWLPAMRGTMIRLVPAMFAWEVLQLPLYTLGRDGTAWEIAFAILHCTAGDALIALAGVRAEVDRFFDEVMVNVDEPLVRANRLGLLKSLFDQLNAVADISRLAV